MKQVIFCGLLLAATLQQVEAQQANNTQAFANNIKTGNVPQQAAAQEAGTAAPKRQTAISTATGFVYEDANNNGKRDRREKAVAGVSVSNGIEVVATDSKGAYSLPVGNDNILFLVKPAGYRLPLNENNLPKFYYIHKPDGSPKGGKYPGVEPTGGLPKSVDFALLKAGEGDDYTALVFGDPQPLTLTELGYFDKGVVSEVAGIQQIQFGISLGDLVWDDLTLQPQYIEVMKKIGVPWHNVMGNHDMNYEAKEDSLSDETFERNFGPANYSFNYGQVHYIIFDDILYPDPRDGKGYWGGFRKAQLDFMENDLKLVPKDKLVICSFHIPLQQYKDTYRNEDRQRYFDLLQPFANTLTLSAHTHLQRNDLYTEKDGWHGSKPHHEYNAGTTSGDWYSGELNDIGVPVSTMRDGTLKGYAFLHIKGNQYIIDYKVAGKPKEYQIKIFAPKIAQQKRNTAGIYANFFMGRPDSKVECRIDGGAWKQMDFIPDADPLFLDALHKYDFTDTLLTGRRPSNPENCTHLWRMSIPNNLPVGEHVAEIQAIDLYGRSFMEKKSFRVL